MPLRTNEQILSAGSLGVVEVPIGTPEAEGGKVGLVQRPGTRTLRCIKWRDDGSHATPAPRTGPARTPASVPRSLSRSAIGPSLGEPASPSRSLGAGSTTSIWSAPDLPWATRPTATLQAEGSVDCNRDGPREPPHAQIERRALPSSPRATSPSPTRSREVLGPERVRPSADASGLFEGASRAGRSPSIERESRALCPAARGSPCSESPRRRESLDRSALLGTPRRCHTQRRRPPEPREPPPRGGGPPLRERSATWSGRKPRSAHRPGDGARCPWSTPRGVQAVGRRNAHRLIHEAERDRHLTVVLLPQVAAILARHPDRVGSLLGDSRIVNRPGHHAAVAIHLVENLPIGETYRESMIPRSEGHEMVKGLMASRDVLGVYASGQRLDALPFAR